MWLKSFKFLVHIDKDLYQCEPPPAIVYRKLWIFDIKFALPHIEQMLNPQLKSARSVGRIDTSRV